jgi:HEAT repeat protein
MTRLLLFVVSLAALPFAAAAQTVPVPSGAPAVPPPVAVPSPQTPAPARPVPAPAPAPRVRVVPRPAPRVPVPAIPPVPDVPMTLDLSSLADLPTAADLAVLADIDMADMHIDIDPAVIADAMAQARAAMDEVRAAGVPDLTGLQEQVREAASQAREAARQAADRARQDAGDVRGEYTTGLNALQQRQYDRAVTAFDRVVAQKSPRSDGALYWKAFAESRLARPDDALATLAQLRRDFPQSRYLTDARVLETDVRRTAGQPIDADALNASEEIKLLAISGIAESDPEKAIPLLEGVLNATNSLAVKKRAIYVLALSSDERAHQTLLRYAKGAGNPDLQVEAIRYLASRRDKTTIAADLRQIYESTQDADVRRAIIDAYRAANQKAPLMVIAGDRATPIDVRRSAVSSLASLASPQELWTLYQQEPDAALRGQMVNVFRSMGAEDQLVQIAKSDADVSVRQRAIRALGERRSPRSPQLLVDLYNSQTDVQIRRDIIQSLGAQNNADALVDLARKESNLELKRDIVRRLSEMAPKNKAAADALMEMLK